MLAERAITNAAEVEKAYGGGVGTSSLYLVCIYPFTDHSPTLDDASDEEDQHLPSSSRRQQKKSQGQVVQPEEEEYQDDAQLATVTVIEDFDPDTIIHGPPRIQISHPNDDAEMTTSQSRPLTKGKSQSALPPITAEQAKARAKANISAKSSSTSRTKPKTKLKMSKRVKYQTKVERGVERKKQRARRTEKAERAGGKASRKGSSSRGGGRKR